ncbi:MAG TPA: HAMP domain-containing sensor histidine kinase [Polyangia bacterium]
MTRRAPPESAHERAASSGDGDHDDLMAAVRARDEFIAIAAHELRNPMAAVLLHVQALRKNSLRGDPMPDLPGRLEVLEQRVKSFIQRATTMLDVTRLNAGAYRLEPEPVLLDEVIRSSIDELRPQAEQMGSAFKTRLEPGILGRWDRLALLQVTSNLLSNAVKYGAGRPITVRAWRESEAAFLQVEDEGIGMSDDDRARVFAKFERAVKRRQHGGFGLGLWIVGQLIEHMRGSIEFTSALERGSTFTVRLPLHPPAQTEERQHG